MEDKELKKKVNQAKATANAEMVADVLARNEADSAERTSLQSAQDAEMAGLQQNNQAQYSNLGQIVSDVEGKISAARQLDETAQRRENAYRYISGLGDTLSGVANLIGTANGAANQQQTYNSNAVVQKAEEARKARKIEIEDLSKRLDEMKARQRDIQAAGSLAEAQLKAKQSKEMAQLQSQQRAKADEAKRYADTQAYRAERDATEDWQKDRAFNAQQEQIKQAQENWQKTYNMQYAKFKNEQNTKNYNFTLADGSIDIPKEKLNESNVERIYKMLPQEIRDTIKGEAYTEYETDEMGNQIRKTGNKAPSLAQKLAAIGAYADSNANVKNELRRLAGMKTQKVNNPEANTKAAPKRDWSSRKDTTRKDTTNMVAASSPSSYATSQVADTIKSLEDDILNGDSVYINGTRYAKL